MRNLKVIGKFDVCGTRVIDADTGQEINNIKSVTWKHTAGEMPTCIVELVGVALEGVAVEVKP